ncbi:hypothetical protein BGZ95_006834 [Linnemannia exigua]|uniref:Uncharacterized protein n=1 Tax=Linnemannia exigua TaxID=604196 RepID=A0AAD4D0M3_9FUNG|nr:hypothetical protein BGZ95_006834 [Linnemannia exigua]
MFVKTATITLLALFASAASAQQMPKHTAFTNPVDGTAVYTTGQNTTFSWTMACRKPSTAVSTGSSRDVEVQLVNSNNPDSAFFIASVRRMDCSKAMGNEYWVVPEVPDNAAKYSLRIMLSTPIYSGQFKIQAKAGGNNNGGAGENTTPGDKQADKHSDNSATGPLVATGLSAVVASAAALLLL